MEQKPSIFPIALKYGIIMAIVSFIVSLASTYGIISGAIPIMLFGILTFVISIVIMIVFIIIGYREFKASNAGLMSYGQGLGLGTLLVLVSGILASVLSIAYFQLIDTEAQQQVADITIQQTISFMENAGAEVPENFEEEQRTQVEANQQPLRQFLFGAGGSLVIGFVVSLIMAAIMKKNAPDY